MLATLLSVVLLLVFSELAAANFKRLAPVLEALEQSRAGPEDDNKPRWIGGWEKLAALVWAFGTSIPLLAFSLAAFFYVQDRSQATNLILGASIGSNVIALSLVFGLTLLDGPLTFFRVRTVTSPVFLLLATLAFSYVCMNLRISAFEGIFLLLLFLGYGFYFRSFSSEWKFYERLHANHTLVESTEGILPVLVVFCMGIGFFFLAVIASAPFTHEIFSLTSSTYHDPFRIGTHLAAIILSIPWLMRCLVFIRQSSTGKAITISSISHSCLINVLLVPGILGLVGTNGLSDNLTRIHLPVLLVITATFVASLLIEKEKGGGLTWILIAFFLIYSGIGLFG